ncbi:MAG: DNA polymerase III subunit beta [candidate division Zixibacteria bacterium]|nr:DNA polymerase III subunit beta [Candidatus Tariuqbacter arcticus]
MHLVVSSKDFANALTPHLQIIPKRSSMPILYSLLWEMEDEGKLKITSTDLEVSLTTVAGVGMGSLFQTGEKHHILVPAIKMFEIMRAISHDEVHIESRPDNTRISIKAGNGSYQIATAKPEDFPALDFAKETQILMIPLAQLTQAVKQTLFAVGRDEYRPTLCGVHLESTFTESQVLLSLTGTDGHRLAQVKNIEVQNPNKSDKLVNVIIPEKAMKFLSRFWSTDDSDAVVKLHYGEKHIKFIQGDAALTTRLIQGKYPTVKDVIPKSPSNILTIEREALLKSVKRVSLLSNIATRQVKVALESNHILISTCDAEQGSEAEEQLSMEYFGDPMAIGFNAQYLMENLRVLESDEVTMKFTSPDNATILRPTDDENILMLLMPVRLTE